MSRRVRSRRKCAIQFISNHLHAWRFYNRVGNVVRVAVCIGIGLVALVVGQMRPNAYVEVELQTSAIVVHLSSSKVVTNSWIPLLEDTPVGEISWRGTRVQSAPERQADPLVQEFHLRSAIPFMVALDTLPPAGLRIEWVRGMEAAIVLTEGQEHEARLRSQIRWSRDIEMRSSGMWLPAAWAELATAEEWTPVPDDRMTFRLVNDAPETSVRVVVVPRDGEADRTAWAIVPVDSGGTETMDRRGALHEQLPFTLISESRRRQVETLVSGLSAESIELSQISGERLESYVEGGRIRFPDSSTREIKVDSGYLLSLVPEDVFHLHTIGISDDGLHVKVSGRARSVQGGYHDMRDLMPPLIEQWYTNKPLGWFITTAIGIASLVAAVWASGRGERP